MPSGGKRAICGNLVSMTDELAMPPGGESAIPSFAALLDVGLQKLRSLLGDQWHVQKQESPAGRESDRGDEGFDALISIGDPGNTQSQIVVECRLTLSPNEAAKVLEIQRRTLRRIYGANISFLLVAPWLSPRVRDILKSREIDYLDLTGNIYIRMTRPGVVIITEGAQEDPNPKALGTQRRLSGAKALRLVRLLVDAAPPYRTSDLAEATGLSTGYVSRLLDVMQRQALIRREGRTIADVDWPALIRARASESALYDLAVAYAISPNGIPDTLDMLVQRYEKLGGPVAVTGTYAMSGLRSVSVGGQLAIYMEPSANPLRLVDTLGLIPAPSGEVAILRAGDDVVFERLRNYKGLPLVEMSQLAIDCLSGPGRLPADGEELLRFMIETEHSWRAPGIQELTSR